MTQQTPDLAFIRKQLLEIVNKASGTKKRHDALLFGLRQEAELNRGRFDCSMLVAYLDRRLKHNEGIVLDHETFKSIFSITPKEPEIVLLQKFMSNKEMHVAPIYKHAENSPTAIFIIIHRKMYQAIEYADDIRSIVTGKPKRANPKAWLVGVAIKINEEIVNLTHKVRAVSKYDILDAMQLLREDEVYFISYNFLMFYNIDFRELEKTLQTKLFWVEKLLSDEKAAKESNPVYKEFESFVGFLVSRRHEGIEIGRDNLDLLFRISEQIDSQLSAPVQNSEMTNGTFH